MLSLSVLLVIVVFLALAFDYINGFHDTANAIATVVSTRALSARNAIIMAAVLNFVGAFYKTGVAKTIAKDIVSSTIVTQEVVIAALIAAIAWNLLTWYYGIPSSSSHAIIGGVMGATVAKAGFAALKLAGIKKVVIGLLISPVLGALIGLVFTSIILAIFGKMSPSKINRNSLKLQILTAGLLSFNHGSNDAQKSMGIITLALLSAGVISSAEVPIWVKLACATAMAAGTAAGGWRIIRTMGSKIFKIEPVYGCAAELSASTVIWAATELSMPVSTTHVVAGSIMGVGAAKRLSAVRWGVAQQMVFAWVLTIPATALVGAVFYLFLHLFIK